MEHELGKQPENESLRDFNQIGQLGENLGERKSMKNIVAEHRDKTIVVEATTMDNYYFLKEDISAKQRHSLPSITIEGYGSSIYGHDSSIYGKSFTKEGNNNFTKAEESKTAVTSHKESYETKGRNLNSAKDNANIDHQKSTPTKNTATDQKMSVGRTLSRNVENERKISAEQGRGPVKDIRNERESSEDQRFSFLRDRSGSLEDLKRHPTNIAGQTLLQVGLSRSGSTEEDSRDNQRKRAQRKLSRVVERYSHTQGKEGASF